MNFYMILSRDYNQYTFTLYGLNRTNYKPYLTVNFGRVNEDKNKRKSTKGWKYENVQYKDMHSWNVKNRIWSPRTNIERSKTSIDFIYSERSCDLYSNRFAVKIDFINTMNQAMSGMGEIATQSTDRFDWIRIRRNDPRELKQQMSNPFFKNEEQQSAFFKLTDLDKFLKKHKAELKENPAVRNYHRGWRNEYRKMILFPTFTTTIETEEEVLQLLTKHMKKNEELSL